ncbi:MAG: hypothetical protein NTZ42_04345 [Candidatus Gribaldobacteria bacterium]|nr:hypothetical protein [Candidatus Gribaldobacteria bacterium]
MKINLNPIKNFFLAFGHFFWRKISLFFLIFLLIDILFMGILLAKCYSNKLASNASGGPVALLNENLFNKTFNRWRDGRTNIEKLSVKQYPDFFKKYSTSTPATTPATSTLP